MKPSIDIGQSKPAVSFKIISTNYPPHSIAIWNGGPLSYRPCPN